MINKIVIFTGDKNNSGDFLIKEKTKSLFEYFLPHAELFFINRTKPFVEKIDFINTCDLVVIAGGPAMVDKCAESLMLVNVLDKITIPIVFFGVGQYCKNISFNNFKYNFTNNTKKLLDRTESCKYYSTVRDFRTLYYLRQANFKNFKFSGCPVQYNISTFKKDIKPFSLDNINSVVFSCGSPFVKKDAFWNQQIELIKSLNAYFLNIGKHRIKFSVALHHSSNIKDFCKVYGKKQKYFKFLNKLNKLNIEIIDISKDSKSMTDLYDSCELHIGYRVHAHIYI